MTARDWFRYLHTAIFGYTAVLPLIGAGTTGADVSVGQMGALLVTAVSFHIFAYLLNDIIDLPLDKTQPSRLNYPLVSGLMTLQRTRLLAVVQLPFLLLLWWLLDGNGLSLLYLLWAMGGMAIYNFLGKRNPLPPLTDFVQGTSWAALLLFGAASVAEPTSQTWLAAGFIIVYILLVNGINGSLRDLAKDLAFGARTTAIWSGARPFPTNHFSIPTRLRLYAFFWQAVLSGISFVFFMGHRLTQTNADFWFGGAIVLLNFLCWGVLWQLTKPRSLIQKTEPLLMTHNILMLLLLFTAVLPTFNSPIIWTTLLVFTLPLLTADWLIERRKWVIRQLSH